MEPETESSSMVGVALPLSGKHTPEGRERLRLAALKNAPWRYSTGPKSPEGKARSSANGRSKQAGTRSIREMKRELAGVAAAADLMAKIRMGFMKSGGD